MNEKFEKILEWPLSKRLGVLGFLVAFIGGMFWLNFYSPVAEEVSSLQEKIDGPKGLRAQIAEQQGIARNLDLFLAEVEKLDVELKKALEQLPDKKEIPQLLARISDKARDAGLDVKLFKPDGEQKKDYFSAVPVQIEVTGTYHQVATFFDEVGHMERIINLDNLSMVEPQVNEDEVTLKTGVVATAFRFLDESERIQELENNKGDATKKRRGATPPVAAK